MFLDSFDLWGQALLFKAPTIKGVHAPLAENILRDAFGNHQDIRRNNIAFEILSFKIFVEIIWLLKESILKALV